MKYSHQTWFSIILAMGLTLLLSLTGLYLLEYVVPFSRNVKGIESASNSFYQAYAGLEQSMYLHRNNIIWYQTWTSLTSSIPEEYSYNISAQGTVSPQVWKWNSEYDRDFNKLSQAEPAQFVIGSWRLNTWGSFLRLSLKIPDLKSPSFTEELSNTWNIVLWQLSSSGHSLTSWVPINHTQINSGFMSQNFLNNSRTGALLNGTSTGFLSFYSNYCNDSGEECVFKLSLISPMYSNLTWNPRIPYLEYKIVSNRSIPLREAVIETQWKSYGFRRSLEVLVPQTTTNSAFDFTVFQ